MKKGDLLFVYGTLMKGERASLYDAARHFSVAFCGEDELNGEIYNLGSFPGAKAQPGNFDPSKPSIRGEVFRIMDSSVQVWLDAYEGYPYMYDRIETETARGRHVWIYTFNDPVSEDKLIRSGDWRTRNEIAPTPVQKVAA